jgi:ferric-dicitrate binding protein FerR (iron transport regulator)
MNMENLAYKYFQGTATKEEETLLMDYVESSDEAGKWFLNERKLWDAYLFSDELQLETELSKIKIKKKTIPLLMHRFSKIAAIFIGAMVLSFAGWYYFSPEKVDMLIVEAVAGDRAEFTLPDGTKVFLNENSRLTYPVSFKNKIRSVELSGEAYFEVTKSKTPFVVISNRCQIKVLGTVFNVKDYATENLSSVSLFEGSVKVMVKNEQKSELILTPNEQLVFNEETIEKHAIENADNFLWRKGIIHFDDVPFYEMVSALERFYDVKVIVKNPRILEYKCTGKFRKSEGIDHLLKVLQKNMDFKYHYSDDKTVIITLNN